MASCEGDSSFTIKFHYDDGTTTTNWWEADDWYQSADNRGNCQIVISNMHRAAAGTGQIEDNPHFHLYEFVFDASRGLDPNRELAAITLGNDPNRYPAGSEVYAAVFAVSGHEVTSTAWRDGTTETNGWPWHSTLVMSGGVGVITADASDWLLTNYAKALSGTLTVDLNRFPILEVGIPRTELGINSYYQIALQDELGEPYPKAILFEDRVPGSGTLILNIPKLTGWTGTHTFAVEFGIWNAEMAEQRLYVDYVGLRQDGNVAWVEEFAPPSSSWVDEGKAPGVQARLFDNSNGTARIVQDGVQGYGSVYSDRLVLDLRDFPWLTARITGITNVADGADFTINVNDAISAGYDNVIPTAILPYERSGRVARFHTNALDQFKLALTIGGLGQTAIVDRVHIAKRGVTQDRVTWDTDVTTLKVGQGQLAWLPATATDYDGHDLTYSARNLPPGATYDGIFSWLTAESDAGTYWFDLLVDNGLTTLTNRMTITLTNATIQLQAPRWAARSVSTTGTTATLSGSFVRETDDVVVEVSLNGGAYATNDIALGSDTFTWAGSVLTSPMTVHARARDTNTLTLSSSDRCEVYSSLIGSPFLSIPVLQTRDGTSLWVLVKGATQVTAAVRYGEYDASDSAVVSTNLSFTHALLVSDLQAGTPYWFQVLITNAAGSATISEPLYYPPEGTLWSEEFDEDPTDWEEWLGATIGASGGTGVVTFAATGVWAKVVSPQLEANVDQFPCLEISIAPPVVWPGAYEIGLLEREGAWEYKWLLTDYRPGTILVNVPELTGWTGTKKFSVEVRPWKDVYETNHIRINSIRLRTAANTAWADGFNPTRSTWGYQYLAALSDNGDGTATLQQSGGTEGWGWIFSELLMLDVGEYPWMTAAVTSLASGASFQGVQRDERITNNLTVLNAWMPHFVASGQFQKQTTNLLDKISLGMVIAGSNKTAVLDRIHVARRAPDVTLTWDGRQTSFKAGEGQTLAWPLTATEYGGRQIQYRSASLPSGASYDGFFRWTTPAGPPGTRWFYLVADNGLTAITNRIALTVTNASIQLQTPEWNLPWLVVGTSSGIVSGMYHSEQTNDLVEVSVNGGAYSTAGVKQSNDTFTWSGTVSASPITLDARVRNQISLHVSTSNRCEVYSTVHGPSFLSRPRIETRDATSAWVMVRASTQVTARVLYGLSAPGEDSIQGLSTSLTHAILVPSLQADQAYWFQVLVTFGAGHSMLSEAVYYPAGGAAWQDEFSDDTGLWRDETTDPGYNGTLTFSGGQGVISVPAAPVGADLYGKILSRPVTADLDECPILEVTVSGGNLTNANYVIAVQDELPPWSKSVLFMETQERPGTMILNIPKLSGWTGEKTFAIEIAVDNWAQGGRTMAVDRVVLRADGNLAWADEFGPPRDGWMPQAYFALLQTNGDGTAKIRQNGGPGWGLIRSEMVVLNADDYPWVTVRGTNVESGGHFMLDAYDCITSNTTTMYDSWLAPFEGSGKLPNGTNVLDRLRPTLVIENPNKSADLDYLRISRTVPGLTLRWDAQPLVFDVPGYTNVAVPFTGTDYDGNRIWYTAVSLPAGATYDGVLRWRSSPRPTTNVITIIASNGFTAVTNTFVVRVDPVDFECDAVRGPQSTNVTIRWGAISGETYRVLCADSLKSGVWTNLGLASATGSVAALIDSTMSTTTMRFYQVRQEWVP